MNVYLIMVRNNHGPDYVYTDAQCRPIVVEAISEREALIAVPTTDRNPKDPIVLYACACDVRRVE